MARRPKNKKSKYQTTNNSPTSWYKDAVIYQLHVRAFFDSGDDGVGDFRGLAAKLDYIKDLGATAIWLLPFYQSPLRDDGYNISDYKAINPAYGTLDDFRDFVEAAHARDIRVIIELVVNHSSDQHPWFQRARRAPPGSPERDYYVWSDTGQEFEEARIIFLDSEVSNWTWDPVARPITGTASLPASPTSISTIRWLFARSRTSSASGWISGLTGFASTPSPT
jgi:maltose alpha-D-glucosyltransferase/alpha-amylase